MKFKTLNRPEAYKAHLVKTIHMADSHKQAAEPGSGRWLFYEEIRIKALVELRAFIAGSEVGLNG